MKDRIAEKALVLKAEGRMARVRLVGGEACRKCGLAAMGLCKPGGTGMVYEVANGIGAGVGDVVKLGLDTSIQAKGYALAYVLPLALFVLGCLAGWRLSVWTGVGGLEAIIGMPSLGGGIAFSLWRLRVLEGEGRMFVKSIVREVPDFDPGGTGNAEGYDYLRAYRQA